MRSQESKGPDEVGDSLCGSERSWTNTNGGIVRVSYVYIWPGIQWEFGNMFLYKETLDDKT